MLRHDGMQLFGYVTWDSFALRLTRDGAEKARGRLLAYVLSCFSFLMIWRFGRTSSLSGLRPVE